jgi:hypothetical protein
MPLTGFQREICRLIAANREEMGESYVAGGAALNEWLSAPRVSRDLDLFHDSEEALQATWDRDRQLLIERGLTLEVVRERPTFVEALVCRGDETVTLEWTQDSAYRFFPLVTHPDLGLTLHPFDLATNKVLALVGRLEVRDWVDVIHCHERLQPLGLLAWAACGKDPGLTPGGILAEASRAHYCRAEIEALAFSGPPPDAGDLSRRWRLAVDDARVTVDLLPADRVGYAVLTQGGKPLRGSREELAAALAAGTPIFHEGALRGAFPRLVGVDGPEAAPQ